MSNLSTKVKGTVIKVGDFFQSQTSDFTKQSIVVKTEGEYPEKLEIDFIKSKTELLDVISIGDTVEVSANIKGREWESPSGEVKYFTSLQGWKLEKK